MQAAIYRHTKIIKILLDRGANTGVKDINGMTALICAAWYCEAETINILIDAGSNVKHKDIYGKTVLNYAWNNDNLKGSSALKRIEQLSR